MPSPIKAFKHSCSGLKFAWSEDQSWKNTLYQAVFGVVFATILYFVKDLGAFMWLLMVGSLFPMVIVETINCSIEAVTDKASPERSLLAMKAKDLGSAAVLLSRLFAIVCWVVVLCHLT
jgi:diacylglycerol kinase (ATP)